MSFVSMSINIFAGDTKGNDPGGIVICFCPIALSKSKIMPVLHMNLEPSLEKSALKGLERT